VDRPLAASILASHVLQVAAGDLAVAEAAAASSRDPRMAQMSQGQNVVPMPESLRIYISDSMRAN
jgi:hypothetical protein